MTRHVALTAPSGMDSLAKQLQSFRRRHASRWQQAERSGEGQQAPQEEGGPGKRPSRAVLAAICAAAAAVLTRPGQASFVAHIRRHGSPAGWLPVARRVAGYRSLLLCSTAKAGGVRYVGLLGNWVPLPGWPALGSLLPGEPQHDLTAIAALQVAVFLAWRRAECIPFLSRHFLLSSEQHTRRRPWTLLGACFSHQAPWHLLHNTLTLLQTGPVLQGSLGRLHFLAFYLITGAVANAGSLLLRRLQRPSQRRVSSLGASGALYAIAAALAVLQHGHQFAWWPAFWAPEVRLTSVQLLLANLALDHFSRGRHGIDTAAHLCGAAAGALWMTATMAV